MLPLFQLAIVQEFWRPMLEIGFLWFGIYLLLRLIQGTWAVQALMGVFVFALIFQLARLLGLQTITWVFTKLFAFGAIALVILFHPELRRALARIGQTTAWRRFLQRGGLYDEVISVCGVMSKIRTGALIAIERDVGLKSYIETGTLIDANISEELIRSIFHRESTLHDGAVVIQGAKVVAAGCLLPLSQNPSLARNLGTRHRAGIGLSEETDAVCIIISEETGRVSVSVYGKLTEGLDEEGLRRVLRSLFVPEQRKNLISKLRSTVFTREESP